ncbi:MAG: glycosyltransferase [Nitrospirae bacterium]|nr:glycosyltransferase [Nitrospirota bacterium]
MGRSRPLLLSVVVPVFRQADTASLTLPVLSRVLRSSLKDFEIVCVDDGSGDDTPTMLHMAAGEDPSIRIKAERKHRGQHGAILEGLAASHGKFVATTDADLEASPEWIPEALRLAQRGIHLVNGARKGWDRSSLGSLAIRIPLRLMGSELCRLTDLSSPYKLVSRELADALLTLRGEDHFLALFAAHWGRPSCEIPLKQNREYAARTSYGLFRRARLYATFLRDLRHVVRWGGQPIPERRATA